jgi:hypothetical protein
MEQIALLNKNSVEIMTKLNDVVQSQKSTVDVQVISDTKGTKTTVSLPTVGNLKQQIDIANTNIKKLAGIGGIPMYMIDGKATKKIKSIDLNREPYPINSINTVKQFNSDNNWFFESLMNPLISVNIDLSAQIEDNVHQIESQRYIVSFEKDNNGNLTTRGLASLNDFRDKFLNRNDISMQDFLSWCKNPLNLGVINNVYPENNMDQQIFQINYKTIKFFGSFDVLKIESDTLNNKVWFHLNTLDYYDITNNKTLTLAIGDQIVLNNRDSSTRYQIKDVSTAYSNFRVTLERVEGYDPIPIGQNILTFYSDLDSEKSVKITIGFDEYNVVFVRPINTDNLIKSQEWSKGMSFYTNDLVLNTDTNINMVDYYISTVYDYGALLKDLVVKKIPSSHGVIPNTPALEQDNFKVVQINKHLTDTEDSKTIKELHAQKNNIKSQLAQINDAIIEKNKELNVTTYKSIAEKSKSQNELNKLIVEQESKTKLLTSIISQITSTSSEPKPEGKFRVRGFWSMPESQIVQGYQPQEIIGFRVQYRYSNKNGKDNPTESYNLSTPVVVDNSSQNQSLIFQQSSTSETQTQKVAQLTTGYFSNWNEFKTDIRKRIYDSSTNQWYWEIEDVSDADTPNINQLDISIQANEKVEIRIKSISEVGYPDSALESDWSTTLTVEFPDDLKNVLSDNEFILKEATQEELRVQFENELNAKGLITHIQESFYVNETYFAHTDQNLATSFKNQYNETVSLYDYLKSLTDRIATLEEIIARAKGELKMVLVRGTEEIEISPNSNINITVDCEDYGSKSGVTRTYYNDIYTIADFSLKFMNIATSSPLGFLSHRTYTDTTITPANTFYKYPYDLAPWVDSDNVLNPQSNNQFVWFQDSNNNVKIYSGTTGSVDSDFSVLLTHNTLNPGLIGTGATLSLLAHSWTGATSGLCCCVYPYLTTLNNLIDSGQQEMKTINGGTNFVIPINIYFRFNDLSSALYSAPTTTTTPAKITRTLKCFLETETSTQPIEFTIIFNLNQYKTTNIVGGNVYYNIIQSNAL